MSDKRQEDRLDTRRFFLATVLVLGLAAKGLLEAAPSAPARESAGTAVAPAGDPPLAEAIFAGGCFWCMEYPFDSLDGVKLTTSGYTGGSSANPTYRQVSAGKTGHTEAVPRCLRPGEGELREAPPRFLAKHRPAHS